jgi:hypothetical protein
MKIHAAFLTINLFALVSVSNAEVTATNERFAKHDRSDQIVSFTLTCQAKEDIFKSPISGFIAVVVSNAKTKQVRHLPTSEIEEVNEYEYGVYIEWKNKRMKNGNGYLSTVVYVPKNVLEPQKVIELINACIRKP